MADRKLTNQIKPTTFLAFPVEDLERGDMGRQMARYLQKKVHISRRPHVLILGDDNAGDDIARDTNHKEDAVDDGEREECSPVNVWLAKTLLDK